MSRERLKERELEALHHIRKRVFGEGRPPSVRELARVMSYRSPRSAAVLIERLMAKGYIERRSDGCLQLVDQPPDDYRATTVLVPLVGAAPCGTPLLAVENREGLIAVSTRMARGGHTYFLLRAVGDSMDAKGICDGDLVLVRRQPAAENGQVVVALIDEEATIKVFNRSESAVILGPRSSNPEHAPILLTDDFQIQGVVVATLPKSDVALLMVDR